MLEEEVLDTHKMVMDQTTRFLNDAHSVFSVTHEVDYDQEGKTVEQHLPIDHSKPPCIFYTRIRTLDILLARVFRVCTHTLHVPMHLRTMNQYIYIYIFLLILFRHASDAYTYLFRTRA